MNRPPLQETHDDVVFTTRDELLKRYADARTRTVIAGELRAVLEDNERLRAHIDRLKAKVLRLEKALAELNEPPEPLPVPPPPPPRSSVHVRGTEIMQAVCKRFGVSRADIMSARRPQVISAPRQLAMALMCRLTLLSTPQIGRVMGGLDHTTVMHARDKFRNLLDALELTSETDVAVWVDDAARAMGR